MTPQQTKIFLCLAACKNFSLAAQQLYISQSVVSYHIRVLEKELGFHLFDRNTHGVKLTPAGQSFYHSILYIQSQYQEAIEQAKTIAQGEKHKLNICFGTPTSPTMMGQIMNRIGEILPLETIDLTKRNNKDVLQPVLSGNADILFTYPPFFHTHLGLKQVDFCMTWLSCMMSPTHPLAHRSFLSFDDLQGQVLILVDSVNAHIEHKDIYQRISKAKDKAPFLETTPKTFEQAQGLALAGRGIMLVRTLDGKYHSNIDGFVSIPLIDIQPMPLLAVWHPKNTYEPLQKLIQNHEPQ